MKSTLRTRSEKRSFIRLRSLVGPREALTDQRRAELVPFGSLHLPAFFDLQVGPLDIQKQRADD